MSANTAMNTAPEQLCSGVSSHFLQYIEEKINKNVQFPVTFVVLTATFKARLLPNI